MIDVWYKSHRGDLYSGGWLAVQFRAAGGYGGYGYDCYSSTPTENNYLQRYTGLGQWGAGTRSRASASRTATGSPDRRALISGSSLDRSPHGKTQASI
ncbi:hypothetical protein GCM10019059_42680 [Camelimonas fluminis]|nr:hypothetical protein GCM10019059_42680 [Camelimonas fluminis]